MTNNLSFDQQQTAHAIGGRANYNGSVRVKLLLSLVVSGARGRMGREFVSYAFQDLPRKKIKKYAAKYEGVDMATLIGADGDNFPFLIRDDPNGRDDDPGALQVMVWNAYNGMMARLDEDSVRHYATVLCRPWC